MSLLAVDIGNGHTVLGLITAGEVGATWRVSTDERRTADEWAALIGGLLGGRLATLRGVAVCATVPVVQQVWRSLLAQQFAELTSVMVEPGIRTGIPVLLDNPREVGADRVVNALAAAHLYGGPAIVVAFGGTATTFDVVNASGQYVGGAISPGLDISLGALRRHGAQLRQVELAVPRAVIAKNTTEALQSGLVYGAASAVDGLITRMVTELGIPPESVSVISTGHLAPQVAKVCSCFTHHEPWLTLRGLELVYARNAR